MTEKMRQVLDVILEKFRTGEVPEAVAMIMFPIPDLPSSKWSLLNRTLMFFAGTQDARRYRQWMQAKRNVKKGTKALRILLPYFKKVENEETGDDKQVLVGFVTVVKGGRPKDFKFRRLRKDVRTGTVVNS